jgi:hypothetical protein
VPSNDVYDTTFQPLRRKKISRLAQATLVVSILEVTSLNLSWDIDYPH